MLSRVLENRFLFYIPVFGRLSKGLLYHAAL
nr:MAG TPA: hypothetical protein [Caudoviricetes sp.]